MHTAEMVHLGRHIERIEEARLAAVSDADYKNVMYPLRAEFARMRAWRSRQEVIDENWEELLRGG